METFLNYAIGTLLTANLADSTVRRFSGSDRRRYRREKAAYQRQLAADLEAQRIYDDPFSQVERMRRAGLPASRISPGSYGQVVYNSPTEPNPVDAPFLHGLDQFGNYLGSRASKREMAKAAIREEVRQQQDLTKGNLEIKQREIDIKHKEIENQLAEQLLEMREEQRDPYVGYSNRIKKQNATPLPRDMYERLVKQDAIKNAIYDFFKNNVRFRFGMRR